MLKEIVQLDQQITLWINGLNSPISDPLWTLFSDAKVWFPAYAVIMILMVVRMGWKKGLISALSLIVMVVLVDQLSGLVKESVMRLRPCYNTWMLENGLQWPYGRPGFYGFFSSHAANTMGFAVTSLMGFHNDPSHSYKAYGWGVFLWAGIVCLSRIMMAAHFLGDVLVGIAFGLLMGYLVGLTARRIIAKAKL